MNETTNKLLLKMTASFTGTVGYGDVYECCVVEVLEGDLDDKQIALVIMAGAKSESDFMSSHIDKGEFLIGFKKKEDNAPYALMPINGFVDKNRSSWEIEFLKDE